MAIAVDPLHAKARSNLGNLLMNVRGDFDGAEIAFRQALELDPSIAGSQWNLSKVLEVKGDLAGAIKRDPIHPSRRPGQRRRRARESAACHDGAALHLAERGVRAKPTSRLRERAAAGDSQTAKEKATQQSKHGSLTEEL